MNPDGLVHMWPVEVIPPRLRTHDAGLGWGSDQAQICLNIGRLLILRK